MQAPKEHIIYGYCNTTGSYAKGVGVGVAVQQGCNLWVLPLAKRARPTAYVSSWIPSVTPANYNLHLLRFVFKHIRDDEGEEEKEMKELLIPRSRRAFFTQRQV